MTDNLDKKICALLYRAQIASDAGKGICRFPLTREADERAYNGAYAVKPALIKKAIDRIRLLRKRGVDPGFRYGVSYDLYTPIVYFRFRANGVNFQISFHCPDWQYGDLPMTNGTKMRWDKGCSFETAAYLYRYYNDRI